jgi:hypothetical protein
MVMFNISYPYGRPQDAGVLVILVYFHLLLSLLNVRPTHLYHQYYDHMYNANLVTS